MRRRHRQKDQDEKDKQDRKKGRERQRKAREEEDKQKEEAKRRKSDAEAPARTLLRQHNYVSPTGKLTSVTLRQCVRRNGLGVRNSSKKREDMLKSVLSATKDPPIDWSHGHEW